MHSQRYLKAIERNLAELQRAILNRTTLVGIETAKGVTSLFLQVSYYALFNDYVAHCIKVFESSKQAASFWYIYRTDQAAVDTFAKKAKLDIAALEKVSGKLKQIRDQTHFHIDSTGVLDTRAVWRQAGLTGKQLSVAIDAAWSILTHLQKNFSLPEVTLPVYYTPAHVHCRVVSLEAGEFKN